MKFGTRLYGTESSDVVAKAQLAEQLGFDSLWRGDHLVLPDKIVTSYPNAEGGRPPFDPEAPVLDVLMVLAHVAQATSSIRLATGIYILPIRDPLQVARSVQTLDILSGGRAVFGCGIGWMREEFELAGRDFSTRGQVMDESIQVLQALWTQARPEFSGEHLSISDCRFEPKPIQRPHPPIVIGGESAAGLRRAARFGDGWYGHRPTPDEAAARVAQLAALRAQVGRADVPFEVTVRVYPDVPIGDIERYEEAGVARLVLEVGNFDGRGPDNDADVMTNFADRVIKHLVG